MTKYVYICAAGYSGSTLLNLILGSHSRMEALGEIALLTKNISLNTECTCGSPVKSCPVWEPIIKDLGNSIDADLFENPYALNLGYPRSHVVIDHEHQTSYYLLRRKFIHGLVYLESRYNISFFNAFTQSFQDGLQHRFLLYDTVRKHQNVDIVVDSSKVYIDGVSLYRKRPEDVRIILLARDGRGVMHSNMKRNQGREKGLVGWKYYYARLLPLIEQHVKPGHCLTVHYEDLAQDTDSELSRICQFLGVEYEPSMKEFASHRHHITNGNDMRFNESSEIRLDTSWQTKLSREDLEYFQRVAGEVSRDLGYE